MSLLISLMREHKNLQTFSIAKGNQCLCNIPNFQFGMLYIDHSCISYLFAAFRFAILEILSNSRTLGESCGFPCFHIWILSNIETRILVLIILLSENISLNKINERRKYDFSKTIEILEEKMLKSFIGIYLDFICNFCCIKNIACFQNIYFVLKKCSPYSRFSN